MKTIEVAAAIIVRGGKIFATKRGYGAYQNMWEFPGGKTEPGETPEAALHREIREELAAEIRIDRFFSTIQYDYPDFHLILHCYLCSLIQDTLTLLEHTEAKWLAPSDLHTVNWLPADIQLIEALQTHFA